MVLLEQVHDAFTEVGHILADHEGEMASIDLLVVDDVVADCVAGPARISEVSQNVLSAGEHGNRDASDVLEGNEVRRPMRENSGVVIGPDLETILFQVLGVVQNRLDRSAVRFVAHVYSKAVRIIEVWVVCHEQFSDELAKLGDVRAEERGGSRGEPVSAEELVNAEHIACSRERVVEVGGKLEDFSLGVRNLGNGPKSDEERHLILEVGRVLRKGAEHLGGSLGMADVGDLLTISLHLDHVDDSWKVISAHIEPAEIPELLLVMIRIIGGMRTAKSVTARVAKPNVVAGARSDESRSNVCIVDDPAVGGI